MSDKPREFWIYHSAINAMNEHHHIITDNQWHLKQDPSALNNKSLWLHVIEKSAYIVSEQARAALDIQCKQLRANLELAVAAIEKHLGRKTRGYPTPQEWEQFCSELKDVLDEVKEQK